MGRVRTRLIFTIFARKIAIQHQMKYAMILSLVRSLSFWPSQDTDQMATVVRFDSSSPFSKNRTRREFQVKSNIDFNPVSKAVLANYEAFSLELSCANYISKSNCSKVEQAIKNTAKLVLGHFVITKKINIVAYYQSYCLGRPIPCIPAVFTLVNVAWSCWSRSRICCEKW